LSNVTKIIGYTEYRESATMRRRDVVAESVVMLTMAARAGADDAG